MDLINLENLGYLELINTSPEEIINELKNTFSESYSIVETTLTPNKINNKVTISFSKVYGSEMFPFHTDGANKILPPRWVILAYNSEFISKAATLLFDTNLFKEMKGANDFLFNEIYFVNSEPYSILTPLINNQLHNKPIFRWNELLMYKANRITSFEMQKYDFNFNIKISWHKGKIVIFDNWRMLHSREAIPQNELGTRELHRFSLTPHI